MATPEPGSPSPAPDRDAATAAVYFSGRDDSGHQVILRRPEPGELLCGSCLAGLATRAAEDDESPWHRGDIAQRIQAELAQIAQVVAEQTTSPLDDHMSALYPASGQRGHDCADAFCAPVWVLRADGCPPDAHSLAGLRPTPCRCGVVSLYEALEQLPATSRQRAFEAHLCAINDLYDHMNAAEAFLDGQGAEAYLPAACLTCLADPAFHVDELDAELTARTLELAPVLRAYDVNLTLGARRPSGPLGATR